MQMEFTIEDVAMLMGNMAFHKTGQGIRTMASGRRAWYAESYYNIGYAYYHGEGVERDIEKAKHYWELAAIGGDADARYNLGILEENAGNMNRALKHYMIAVGCGDTMNH